MKSYSASHISKLIIGTNICRLLRIICVNITLSYPGHPSYLSFEMSYYFMSVFIIVMSLRLQVLSNHISKTMGERPKISTHVLDTSRGLPASGLSVSLYYFNNGQWTLIKESTTNSEGRCQDLISSLAFTPGRYKLHYEIENYFTSKNIATFFPFIEVVFDVSSKEEHYHVPLLLSPFGYSTYRGT
ncbi:unnamed protein product [Nezara viridula]|uniref:hydroxyisourate hydrolase n=1 Tax=Nezara viridula TaxID=85310 RepID=A0A9P0EAA6_NEZVI|nr:unnamed protein product [Nezara viridula]